MIVQGRVDDTMNLGGIKVHHSPYSSISSFDIDPAICCGLTGGRQGVLNFYELWVSLKSTGWEVSTLKSCQTSFRHVMQLSKLKLASPERLVSFLLIGMLRIFF